ncbi:hypothetical protein [Mycoplasmoides gallisepticum]|nr:hypothetical protein [Mycoplasmoides gallisepticum]
MFTICIILSVNPQLSQINASPLYITSPNQNALNTHYNYLNQLFK